MSTTTACDMAQCVAVLPETSTTKKANSKFVRFILDLTQCADILTPFVRLRLEGHARKEIIVAEHIAGTSSTRNLYMAVAVWPEDVRTGDLQLGMLGYGKKLGVQLEENTFPLTIDEDTMFYITWAKSAEVIWTATSEEQNIAVFVNESLDTVPVGVIGDIPELGNWDPDTGVDGTILYIEDGLSLCIVALDPLVKDDRPVDFRLIKFSSEEGAQPDIHGLVWEKLRGVHKHIILASSGDMVIWSAWQLDEVQTTRIHPTKIPRKQRQRPSPGANSPFNAIQDLVRNGSKDKLKTYADAVCSGSLAADAVCSGSQAADAVCSGSLSAAAGASTPKGYTIDDVSYQTITAVDTVDMSYSTNTLHVTIKVPFCTDTVLTTPTTSESEDDEEPGLNTKLPSPSHYTNITQNLSDKNNLDITCNATTSANPHSPTVVADEDTGYGTTGGAESGDADATGSGTGGAGSSPSTITDTSTKVEGAGDADVRKLSPEGVNKLWITIDSIDSRIGHIMKPTPVPSVNPGVKGCTCCSSIAFFNSFILNY